MSNKKISELTAKTTPELTDLTVIVDGEGTKKMDLIGDKNSHWWLKQWCRRWFNNIRWQSVSASKDLERLYDSYRQFDQSVYRWCCGC